MSSQSILFTRKRSWKVKAVGVILNTSLIESRLVYKAMIASIIYSFKVPFGLYFPSSHTPFHAPDALNLNVWWILPIWFIPVLTSRSHVFHLCSFSTTGPLNIPKAFVSETWRYLWASSFFFFFNKVSGIIHCQKTICLPKRHRLVFESITGSAER